MLLFSWWASPLEVTGQVMEKETASNQVPGGGIPVL
jgi:hypothetical protein